MIHGYGGTSGMFYTMMRDLSKRFKLYLIDIIGMGGSTRAKNYNKDGTAEETLEYLTIHIEKWRAEMKLD